MTTIASFDVLGVPKPQGSMRAFNNRVVHAKPKALMDWRGDIAKAAADFVTEKAERGTPVWIHATFRLERPKAAPKRVIRPTTKPDLDKLVRSLLDALTGICFADDSQVVSLNVGKRFAAAEEPCGVFVEVLR